MAGKSGLIITFCGRNIKKSLSHNDTRQGGVSNNHNVFTVSVPCNNGGVLNLATANTRHKPLVQIKTQIVATY